MNAKSAHEWIWSYSVESIAPSTEQARNISRKSESRPNLRFRITW